MTATGGEQRQNADPGQGSWQELKGTDSWGNSMQKLFPWSSMPGTKHMRPSQHVYRAAVCVWVLCMKPTVRISLKSQMTGIFTMTPGPPLCPLVRGLRAQHSP